MGEAVAKALGSRGCRIVLTWRNSKKAADTAVHVLEGIGISAMAVRCDIAIESSIQKALKAIQKRYGRLDIVINLASIYEQTKLMGKGVSQSSDIGHGPLSMILAVIRFLKNAH